MIKKDYIEDVEELEDNCMAVKGYSFHNNKHNSYIDIYVKNNKIQTILVVNSLLADTSLEKFDKTFYQEQDSYIRVKIR